MGARLTILSALIVLVVIGILWRLALPPAQPTPSAVKESGKTVDTENALIYLPTDLQPDQQYPLVLSFSPVGNAQWIHHFWQPFANKHHWIIYSSKVYRNLDQGPPPHPSPDEMLQTVMTDVQDVLKEYPVDQSRIVLTGLSGGTSFSHLLNLRYPGFAAAMILNTGKCWEFDNNAQAPETIAPYYNQSRKLAVFLASPTDFRYQEMIRDRDLWQRAGWQTEWLEFDGGHAYAPPELYEKAIEWIEAQSSWNG